MQTMTDVFCITFFEDLVWKKILNNNCTRCFEDSF